MVAIVESILPVFILIGLGFGIRRARLLPDSFWPAAEGLTYYLTFPALLITNTAKAALGGDLVLTLAVVLLGPIVITALLLAAVRAALHADGRVFSSIFQGALRPNTYIGLAVAKSLLDQEKFAMAALCVALAVPLVNVLSVAALTAWVGDRQIEAKALLRPLAKNPLIIACAIGALLNAFDFRAVALLLPTLEILGQSALPIGLLAIGAGLIREGPISFYPLLSSSVIKLLVLPAITALVCHLWRVEHSVSTVVVFFSALPTAPSSYILARQMHGDAALMANIIALQTLLALCTLPLLLFILR